MHVVVTPIDDQVVAERFGIAALYDEDGGLATYCRRSDAAYYVPGDTGAKTYLAKILASMAAEADAIFYVHDTEIYASAGFMPLFRRVRESQGLGGLAAAGAELVTPDEEEYLTCLIALGLYFFWDFALLRADGSFWVFVSHDEEFFLGGTPDAVAAATELLESDEFDQIDRGPESGSEEAAPG
jgi:hypothetical protein